MVGGGKADRSSDGWDHSMTRLSATKTEVHAVKDSIRSQVERYLAESLLSLRESKKSVRDDSIRIGWCGQRSQARA